MHVWFKAFKLHVCIGYISLIIYWFWSIFYTFGLNDQVIACCCWHLLLIKFRNVLLRQAVYAHEWGSTLYMYIYVFSCFLWCGEFKVPSVLIQGKLIPEISPVTGTRAWIIVLPILCESISPVFEPSVISVLQKHYSSPITYIILLLLRYVYSETEFL
jgi:hypothetical protein